MARLVTLLVEDGSIVPNANSFVDEDQIVAYATARGVTLPNTSDEEKDAVAILGVKAADYLRVLQWRGELVDANQPMPWPRKNLNMTVTFPENAIPLAVIEAQLQLTLLSNAGIELIPQELSGGFITVEKIGPIETRYSEKVGVSQNGLPILPGISLLLEPWLIGDMTGLVPVGIWSIGPRCRYGT